MCVLCTHTHIHARSLHMHTLNECVGELSTCGDAWAAAGFREEGTPLGWDYHSSREEQSPWQGAVCLGRRQE